MWVPESAMRDLGAFSSIESKLKWTQKVLGSGWSQGRNCWKGTVTVVMWVRNSFWRWGISSLHYFSQFQELRIQAQPRTQPQSVVHRWKAAWLVNFPSFPLMIASLGCSLSKYQCPKQPPKETSFDINRVLNFKQIDLEYQKKSWCYIFK